MKIRNLVAAVTAGVMMAAMSVTSFAASEIWSEFDDDGVYTVYDDGSIDYYNFRKNSYSWMDEDGNFGEVDRRGNVTYYDSDDDELYDIGNSSSRSSSSSRRRSSSSSSSRSRSRRTSGNGRVTNDLGGWQNMNGTWKYRRQNGSYATNCWEQVNGKWYSFDNNGNMRTSQWVRHTTNEHLWYYVGPDGAMVKNTTIGGYVINANGECFC